jgi:ABC-type lipoprotein export system ATPase subunit
MSDNIIEFKNVCRSYKMGNRTLDVLKGVDFSLARGEWCCIYGASGSGKTTLLNLAGLLEKPDSGNVIIDGQDTGKFSRHTSAIFRSTEIGFVFQSYHLLPELTMLENVMVPNLLGGMDKKKCLAKSMELLERFGIADRIKHHPAELSGGEQQRAAIARALVKSPRLLLADEPTGNLDSVSGEKILELFAQLRDEGLPVVMITHNSEAAARADNVVRLVDGEIKTPETYAE